MINGIKERFRGWMTNLAKGAQKVGATTKETREDLVCFAEQVGYEGISLGMILREVPGAIGGNEGSRRNLRVINEVISEIPFPAKEAVLEMRRRMTRTA